MKAGASQTCLVGSKLDALRLCQPKHVPKAARPRGVPHVAHLRYCTGSPPPAPSSACCRYCCSVQGKGSSVQSRSSTQEGPSVGRASTSTW